MTIRKIYFERKLAEGKHQNLIRINIKNKMLHTVFAVVHRKTPYNSNFVKTLAYQGNGTISLN